MFIVLVLSVKYFQSQTFSSSGLEGKNGLFKRYFGEIQESIPRGQKGKENQIKGEDILLVIEIPSISLKQNVYNMYSSFNDVNQFIQILEESRIEDNVFFLAGHSGDGKASYFNDLSNLEVGDFIVITMRDKRLVYVVENCELIWKDGMMEVEYSKDSLFLITCSLEYRERQLVVRSHLAYQENVVNLW